MIVNGTTGNHVSRRNKLMDALLQIDFQKTFFAKDGRMPIGPERAGLIMVANRLID
jgi:nicotinamidase-related amidase